MGRLFEIYVDSGVRTNLSESRVLIALPNDSQRLDLFFYSEADMGYGTFSFGALPLQSRIAFP